ncbi:MAG: DUF4019 domain-containing protein [Pyrinomonadaceae bacterium]
MTDDRERLEWASSKPALFHPLPLIRVRSSLRFTSSVLVVALFNFACATVRERRTIPPEVESAIGTISDEIAAERYENIYKEASDLWRQDATLDESVAALKTLRSKLGLVENRTLQSAIEQENSSGPLKGRAYIVTYRTKFQNGEGMETYTLVERNSRWELARYFVNSTALK